MKKIQDSFSGSEKIFNDLVLPIRPELPPELEHYRLCDSLGTGAIGTVFRSIQTKEIAIKVIPWGSKNLREVARREYETAKLFDNCETTIHVIDYYEHNENSFILQEIGERITDYYFKHTCSLRMLLQALLDISSALSFIHSKGYTHFDVKPSNIFYVKDRTRLGDFSHCLPYTRGQKYEKALGTGAFKAPEVIPGEQCSGLEDIYSLGITMYVLLMAGALPFEEKEDVSTENSLCIHSLFIHPDLLSIIQNATALDTSVRYQDFDEFSDDIRTFMEKYNDYLDEKVPTYNSTVLQRPTVPPFFDSSTVRTDLS